MLKGVACIYLQRCFLLQYKHDNCLVWRMRQKRFSRTKTRWLLIEPSIVLKRYFQLELIEHGRWQTIGQKFYQWCLRCSTVSFMDSRQLAVTGIYHFEGYLYSEAFFFFLEPAFSTKHLSSIWMKGSLEHLRKSLFRLVLNGQFISL